MLTLWEPQRDLLTGDRSPFDPGVRRMVLAVPTSSGKTLIAQMLAVEYLDRTGRSVCYVAPTRSLCREVRRAMTSRVRVLQKETGPDLPDFPGADRAGRHPGPGAASRRRGDDPRAAGPSAAPRRAGVLERFGMFIFDEAQHLKETGRGFTLEAVIALLDYLSRETDHQIVLISAAMGNAGAIAQWLSPDGQALRHESQWRGPRRLHAAFTTEAHWDETRVEQLPRGTGLAIPAHHPAQRPDPAADGRRPDRALYRRRDRLAAGPQVQEPTPRDSPGWTDDGTRIHQAVRDRQRDDRRARARRIGPGRRQYPRPSPATSLRDSPPRSAKQPALAPLVDFVRLQLGDDHPLVAVLPHGVGFHHAGLPIEVLEALEQAVRDDSLPYLTCTSTLTDGVNLPVRTVIIYDQTYQGQDEDARLRGARLVNAMGRAGRAGKETEGWIVLVRAAEPTEARLP